MRMLLVYVNKTYSKYDKLIENNGTYVSVSRTICIVSNLCQVNNNKKAVATIYFNSLISQNKLLVLSVKMYNTTTAVSVTLFHRTAKQLDKTVSI